MKVATEIPVWRQSARGGLTLAEAKAAAGTAAAGAEVKLPAPEQMASPNERQALEYIIRPSARDRWMGQCVRNYTPERVEQVLRGAVSGNLVQVWELFDLMEGTAPRIAKNLNEVKRAVVAHIRTVQAWTEEDQPASPEAEDRGKLVSNALWTMRPKADENQNGYDQTVYDILDAWGKGIAVLEVDWEVRTAPGRMRSGQGKMMAPKCTRWIHPRFYGYPLQQDWLGLNVAEIDAAATLSGAEPRPGNLDRPNSGTLKLAAEVKDGLWARFPDNKFLICVSKAKSGHASVAALLRPLAFWWAASNFTETWFLNLAQIFGLPIRWANYDPNQPELFDKVCEMLENMGSQAWAAFPAGTQLQLLEPTKGTSENPQVSLLDRAERQYDILILGQTLTTTQGERGSQALGVVHKTVRDEIVEAAARFVETVLNQQLVPAIVSLNYGDVEMLPEICLEPNEVDDEKANAERDQILMTAGVEMPKTWFYKRHQIPLPKPGEEVVKAMAPMTPGANGGGTDGEKTTFRGGRRGIAIEHCKARDAATEKLIENGLEELSGVEARWLAGVKPVFRELIAKAEDESLSDADFVRALERAQGQWPEFFGKLDAKALQEWFLGGMGAAVVNGAVRGYLERKLRAGVANRGGGGGGGAGEGSLASGASSGGQE